MAFARKTLWFYFWMSLVFGGAYLVAPELLTKPLGIASIEAMGWTDLRATYAGFQLGMGGFLWWCLRDPSRTEAGLVAFACLVAALACGRVVGFIIDGFTTAMFAAFVLETGLTAFTLFVRNKITYPAA
jgi:hypothetical protein